MSIPLVLDNLVAVDRETGEIVLIHEYCCSIKCVLVLGGDYNHYYSYLLDINDLFEFYDVVGYL